MSKELQQRRISVNAVAPGPMDTRELHHLFNIKKIGANNWSTIAFFYGQESPEAVEYHKSNGMGNRLTQTTDIAPLVRFLCTEGAWITGQTIFANGGYTTR